MSKQAILFGASGFVGSYLLEELLHDPAYEKVTIVVRKKLALQHPKLTMLLGDIHTLPDLKNEITADDVFIALGTTKKNTPDRISYYQADHDYPVAAARTAKEKGATSVFLVSAVGTDINSAIFYVRTKAETERDITALGFAHTHIFRPSIIMGNRKEKRVLEKILIKIFAVINPLFIGPLNRFRGIQAKDIARAMHTAAKERSEKLTIYHWKEMQELL